MYMYLLYQFFLAILQTEIFQKDVPEDLMAHYREYIFFPMHMGKIKNKVEHGRYQSTRAFLHDAEWILHNCIIYNGGMLLAGSHVALHVRGDLIYSPAYSVIHMWWEEEWG